MAPRRKTRARDAQIAFEALAIEGGLLSPDWLSRIAQLQAGSQSESDYRVPKGLNLRDEMGRYWRIAQAHWKEFDDARGRGGDLKKLAERFVPSLLREAFGFTSLAAHAPVVIAERSYPIGWAALEGSVPVIIGSAGQGLDTLSPAFGDGSRRRTAFGLAQEFLNAQDGALWGIATDGATLRIARDNASLTRPAWIEADLSRIFAEERYADFTALWLLMHETRFGRENQSATDCALEEWRNAGREEGTRAREHLRRSVEEALIALGQGFLAHPANGELRANLQRGALTTKDYFNQLLRLVYRAIFLLTVEERGLLHPPGTSEDAAAMYAGGYSMRRLRERSVRRNAHDRFSDLWEGTKIVFRGLATGEPRLGLPALAGLFAVRQCPALDSAKLENRWLLLAVFRLAWLREDGALARVNWRDMGPEELGSVYESLLELVPQITQEGRQFAFATGGETKGNARKTSGSYYTPDSLVQVLLDSALEPVVADTVAQHPDDPVEALLRLSIVDPACGSGHFLLAAARRLATHVARLQANGTPSAAEYRRALRQVVGRSIYGVDLNPMAVELCKVSLWMEALEPGLPLTFLDPHIQHGNALLGTTPQLMSEGIPDEAWESIEGDDRKIATALKKRNKAEAGGQRTLRFGSSNRLLDEQVAVVHAIAELEAASDASFESLALKESQWEQILDSVEYQHQKFVADAWCAAFVWPKQPGDFDQAAPTNELWRQLRDGERQPSPLTMNIVRDLAGQYSLFHWHLQFPQVMAKGGFDLVLGNPPWEELTPSAKEFFSVYSPDIRSQDKVGEATISKRLMEDPVVAAAWASHSRWLYGQVHSLKASGRHTLFSPGNLGKGDFNVYRMFVETALRVTREGGYAAQLVPETLYSGATTMAIRRELFERFDWRLLLGLENAGEVWFEGVDSRAKFCLYTARKLGRTRSIRVAFNVRSHQELSDSLGTNTPIYLTPDAIRAFSPEAFSIMEVSSAADLELATRMHSCWPTFMNKERHPPLHKHMRELDMTTDSSLFREQPPGLPVYEGRMVGLFDHRAKGYRSGKARTANWVEFSFSDETKRIQPQFYVLEDALPSKLGRRPSICRVGFCNIASPTNARTLVATLIPPGSVCGNKVPTITFDEGYDWFAALWVGVANSLAMDFLVRKKVSLTMTNTIIDSLPFPRLERTDPRATHLVPLVARLCCVGKEMQPYWDLLSADGWVPALDTERDGLIDEAMRYMIEAEINAAVALKFFGLSAADLAHILDTFTIVEKRDRETFGEYRTKRVILETYDAMAKGARTGEPYQTRLEPPPADPRVAHSPREATLAPLAAATRVPASSSQSDTGRELPAWTPDLLPLVAARTGLNPAGGRWATSLSGYDLGFRALAAVLRNLPASSSQEEVERAVVLTVLPSLLRSGFDPKMLATWRQAIGAVNMALTSIAALSIPWGEVRRRARIERILDVLPDGQWTAGPDVQDAPSPELDARALVSLTWLANMATEDQQLIAEVGVLRVA
jgi:hypothetical protein